MMHLNLFMTRQMVMGNAAEQAQSFDHVSSALEGCNPAVLRHVRPTPQHVLTQLRERLEPVLIPRLVLAGSRDNFVLPRDQRTLAELLKARYEEVDSGFMTFLAHPQACARIVLSFWRENQRAATS